jgi:hypothetical protein
VEEDRVIEDKEELKAYISEFYKNLFGGGQEPRIQLSETFWTDRGRCGEEQNQWLVRPFTMIELEEAVKEMKSNTAPGPDGFSTSFLQTFLGSEQRGYFRDASTNAWG